MEGFYVFVTLIALVFSVFQIVLMFRLWSACNTIDELKRAILYKQQPTNEQAAQKVEEAKPTATDIANDSHNANVLGYVVLLLVAFVTLCAICM